MLRHGNVWRAESFEIAANWYEIALSTGCRELFARRAAAHIRFLWHVRAMEPRHDILEAD
jgi:hypothetical protein